jgi:hypothetical protein
MNLITTLLNTGHIDAVAGASVSTEMSVSMRPAII